MRPSLLLLCLALGVAAASLAPASSELKQLKQSCKTQLESTDGGKQRVDRAYFIALKSFRGTPRLHGPVDHILGSAEQVRQLLAFLWVEVQVLPHILSNMDHIVTVMHNSTKSPALGTCCACHGSCRLWRGSCCAGSCSSGGAAECDKGSSDASLLDSRCRAVVPGAQAAAG